MTNTNICLVHGHGVTSDKCPECEVDAALLAFLDLREAVRKLLQVSTATEKGDGRCAPNIVWSQLTEAYNKCK
jgi:hypothetical protein